MNKTTKGAIAAATAAILLLGGVGTLAYWTDDATVDGGSFDSGSIELLDGICGDDWLHVEDDTIVVNAVPGDTVYKECDVTLNLVGDHIAATIEIDETTVVDATIGDPQSDTLTVSAVANPTEVTGEGSHQVAVTITVEWPYGEENNDSQLSTATFDTIGLVATQLHDAG